MAMAIICCLPVRPIVSSRAVSVGVEQAEAGGIALAEPVLRETPRLYSVTIFDRQRRVGHQFSVPEDQSILQAGEDRNLLLPFSCRQGCCTACSVRIRSGQFYQPEALGISAVLKAKVHSERYSFVPLPDNEMLGYGLLCVGYALSDLELETQDEDEVYLLQFGQYFGRGTIVKDDYALDLIMGD